MKTRRSFLIGLLSTPAIVRAEILDFVPRGPILNPDHGPLRLCWPPETDGYDYGPFTEPIVANKGWTDEFVRRVSESGNRLNLSIRQSPLPLKGEVTTLTVGPPRIPLSELRSGNCWA